VGESAVLVTGAAGFLGSAVCSLLAGRNFPFIAIDRVHRKNVDHEVEQCDIGDIHALHALAVKHSIRGIVHCGGLSGPMVGRNNPYAMVQVNIVGTANVLELARVHSIPRVVFCSSAGAYGNTLDAVVSEDSALRPTNLYGASKVAGEQLVTCYSSQYGVDGVSLRLCWVYGPHRSTDCVIRTMLEGALKNEPIRIPFGRDFFRQFVHVQDAASALVAALEQPRLPRTAYNVTGGRYVTLEEVAEIVRKLFPTADIRLDLGPDPIDDIQQQFDISAAEEDLSFKPSVGLEEGITLYARWLMEQNTNAQVRG
jgi:UDP-glucuronate 4-epimerase